MVLALRIIVLTPIVLILSSWLSAAPLADFDVYLAAARKLSLGQNPYQPLDGFFVGVEPVPSYYFYPPTLVVLLERLLWLEVSTLRQIWSLLSILAIAFGAFLLARKLTEMKRYYSILALVFLYPPTYDGLYLGQVNGFVFLLLCLALTGIFSERRAQAAIATGLATGLKNSPALLVVALFGPNWRSSIYTFSATLSLIFLSALLSTRGLVLIADYFHALRSLAEGERFFFRPDNYSLGVLLYGALPAISTQSATHIAQVIAAILLTFAVLRTDYRSSQQRALLFVEALLIMIIASPIVWYHHLTWLLVAHIYLLTVTKSQILDLLLWVALIISALSFPIDSYLALVALKEAYFFKSILAPSLVVVPCCIYLFVAATTKAAKPAARLHPAFC